MKRLAARAFVHRPDPPHPCALRPPPREGTRGATAPPCDTRQRSGRGSPLTRLRASSASHGWLDGPGPVVVACGNRGRARARVWNRRAIRNEPIPFPSGGAPGTGAVRAGAERPGRGGARRARCGRRACRACRARCGRRARRARGPLRGGLRGLRTRFRRALRGAAAGAGPDRGGPDAALQRAGFFTLNLLGESDRAYALVDAAPPRRGRASSARRWRSTRRSSTSTPTCCYRVSRSACSCRSPSTASSGSSASPRRRWNSTA